MQEFYITNATKEDLEAILEIDRVCLDGFWSEISYLCELNNNHTSMPVLRSGNKIIGVGVLWLYSEEAHIVMLAVNPDYQNQGLGRAIVWQMLYCAHKFGAEWIVLEVRVSNTKAIGLYKQFGFVEVGRRKAYYANNQEDALILWCKRVNTTDFIHILIARQTEILHKLSDRGWHWLDCPKVFNSVAKF